MEYNANLFTSNQLKVSEFAGNLDTPGNVGICLSGGSSRAMCAGSGQLLGLKKLGLLSKTKAISTVSGGSWVGTTFLYLDPDKFSEEDFLGEYLSPDDLTVNNISKLNDDNINSRCVNFSKEKILVQSIGLLIGGLEPSMLWQTLVGINFLKHYNLYSPQNGHVPNSFFTFDDECLAKILQKNPELDKYHSHLIYKNQHTINKPFLICNMSMFVEEQNTKFQYLVPVQSTPFFTGVMSSPDVVKNASPVGNGGVTSFAFNSELDSVEGENVTITQSRPFSLTDAIGTSSSFYAESLKNLGTNWQDKISNLLENKIDFVKNELHKIKDFIHPKHKEKFVSFSSKIGNLKPKDIDLNEYLSNNNIDINLIKDAFEKIKSIVPSYDYWSPKASNSQSTSKFNFADGGDLENTGINNMLSYQDIDNIISFINSSTALQQGDKGIVDSNGQTIKNTNIIIDDQVSSLFGYQAYDKNKGYILYSDSDSSKNNVKRYNQIFPSNKFAELLQGLWNNSQYDTATNFTSNMSNYMQTLQTIDNNWFNIKGGRQVKVLWVYTNFSYDWYNKLPDETREKVFNNDPNSFYNFPHYSTTDTNLTSEQIKLLSNFAAWNIIESNSDIFTSMYE